jgi:hypothetical protein
MDGLDHLPQARQPAAQAFRPAVQVDLIGLGDDQRSIGLLPTEAHMLAGKAGIGDGARSQRMPSRGQE